ALPAADARGRRRRRPGHRSGGCAGSGRLTRSFEPARGPRPQRAGRTLPRTVAARPVAADGERALPAARGRHTVLLDRRHRLAAAQAVPGGGPPVLREPAGEAVQRGAPAGRAGQPGVPGLLRELTVPARRRAPAEPGLLG